MDPAVGDLPRGDVLVEDGLISQVAAEIRAPDAEVIDATGSIVLPGLVNAHLHTWQTALRGVASNWTILEYFHHVHAGLATKFGPEDIFIATLVGALNQINCGATTLVDWCHNNPTPEHTDRAIDGLAESGIRAAFFHGSPKPDPKPGQKPFWEVPHPRSEVERLMKRLPPHSSTRDGLVSLGLAILGPHYSTYEVAQHDFRLAREFGLIASMHCAGGEARTPDGWDRLAAEGLLGDNNNIVHGQTLTDAQLELMIGRGVSFSLTPETEMLQGHGFAITGRLRKLGAQPSLGVDFESGISGDLFTVARVALASQRAIDNAESRAATGKLPETSTVRCREALGLDHDRRRAHAQDGGPHRVAHAGQAGRRNPDPRRRPQHVAGARSGHQRGHAGRHRKRRHGDDRGRNPQAPRQARLSEARAKEGRVARIGPAYPWRTGSSLTRVSCSRYRPCRSAISNIS